MDPITYDEMVSGLYRAACGLDDWGAALQRIASTFDSWAVQIFGIEKGTGRLIFSHYAGSAPPEASLGYITKYHAIDPRAGLLMTQPDVVWVHCVDHFDDAYVAESAFYQDFLLPYGGRYVTGTKVYEDADALAVFSAMRGVGRPPFDDKERADLKRLAEHVREAIRVYRRLRAAFEEAGAGRELLDKFAYPMLLIDELGGIRFRNKAAAAALEEGDYIVDRSGVLACRDRHSHNEFMAALQEMGLQGDAHAAPGKRGRRYLRIRRLSTGTPIITNLVAIRPHATMKAFGNAQVALALFHDPAASRELDSFLVAELFDLTPAEARVAVALRRGHSAQTIAADHRLALATVRSQIQSIFAKTGVNRQADLVRLLEGLAGFETLAE